MSATPRTHRAELAASEAHLLASLDQSDDWASEPSGLPGWRRGHVVAHLLGNAEGMLNLAQWATTGAPTPMYASAQARDAAIDERAHWPLTQLRGALEDTAAEFAVACDRLVEPLGAHDLTLGSGAPVQAWQLPTIRQREIEIHRVDLADGYAATDWPTGFSLRTMNQVLPFMSTQRDLPVSMLVATDTGRAWVGAAFGPRLFGAEADLVAWLIGRPHEGLTTRPAEPVPPAPRWV